MKYHKTHEYLLDPQHKITVCVIGCGGTGSQVLSALARMNTALMALGHLGLHVIAFDDDLITEANIGRQLFSESEIGTYKVISLISRLNAFYGSKWEARPIKFQKETEPYLFNIYITCVDNFKSRLEIGKKIKKNKGWHHKDLTYYWMDFGNTNSSGQVILGTLYTEDLPFPDPTYTSNKLPCFDEWAKLYHLNPSTDNTPSCSLAEALEKQDLQINTILANLGIHLLWKLFREKQIAYRGIILNLDTLSTNPIPV